MSLWARLALSYLAVMIIFFGVLALAAPVFSPRRPRPPHELIMNLRREVDASPLPLEQAVLASVPRHPKAMSITVFYPGQAGKPLLGTLVKVSPEELQTAQEGQTLASLPRDGGFTGLIPVRHGQAVLALRVSAPPMTPEETEYRIRMGYIRASLLALLVCTVVGFLLSRAVTRPVRKLAQATEAFGPESLDYRIKEGGPRELAELTRSFNRMADRLQQSVETLRDSEAARREFLGDVSHNLMTPLAASMGWVQAMLDGIVRDKKEEKRHLERIQRELTFVSRSVRRLLELSRWEQSEPELRFEVFPLVEPLMEVAETLEESAASRNVELSFEGLDARWKVEGDRGRVRELLQILLENAVLHAGRDVTIKLKTEHKAGRVWISISDNGFGIPAEDLPFVRKGFRRSSGRNTGLGLAIADRLARSHGGVLELDSEMGKGTTVRFSLQAAEPT